MTLIGPFRTNNADNVKYDNTGSGLIADNVQSAINEIVSTTANIVIKSEVDTFLDLPAANIHNGETYLVKQYSTDKLSGLYYSDGSNWLFRDDKITYSVNAFTGTNKLLKVNSTTTKEIIETAIEIDNSNNLDLKNGGLKDTNVTTAVNLGSLTDTSLNTTKKDILGGINELKSTKQDNLVSTTNIKSVNSVSLLGSGNYQIDHTACSNIGTNSHSTIDNKISKYDNVLDITKDPTGFISPADVVVTYNSTDRTITLTGTTTAYYRGVLISSLISGWVSDPHTDAVGVYYLSYNGTSFVWGSSFPDFSILQIAVVNRRASNSFGNRECHGLMQWQSHKELHETIGTYRTAGGDISNLVLASTTADNRRPIISACTIQDEDLPTTNAILSSKKYSQRFLSGASDINYTLQADDIVPLLVNNPYYNSFSTPNFGQTLMPNNSVMTVWLYEIPTSADSASQEIRHAFVQGQSITQATNSSAGALLVARNTEKLKNPSDLNLGVASVVAAEYVCIHKFILQYANSNWTITDSIAITGTRASQSSSAAGNYLSTVSTDSTLVGNGIASNPIGINLTNANTWSGVQTFSSFPVSPSSAPSANYEMANKKYVDDSLANKVTANSAITGATKTKITYDAKGLVISGSDIALSDVSGAANVDGSNMTLASLATTAKTNLSDLFYPDLTAGSDKTSQAGTSLTAGSNGWIYCQGTHTSGTNPSIAIAGVSFQFYNNAAVNGNSCIFLPIKSGKTYQTSGTITSLVFYPTIA